eukprot:3617101-Rhodomonas_salina.1
MEGPAFFGPDGAVATAANGTRLQVPANLFPAFRDPDDLDVSPAENICPFLTTWRSCSVGSRKLRWFQHSLIIVSTCCESET